MLKLIFSFLILISLTSCAKTEVKPEYPYYFSGAFEMTCSDSEISGTVEYNNEGLITEISSPMELRGFVIEINGEQTIVRNNGIELKYDSVNTEILSPFTDLYATLTQLNTSQPELTGNGRFPYVTLEADGIENKVKFDSQSGKIVQVNSIYFTV